MVALRIKELPDDLSIIKKRKESLLKRFSLGSENNIRDAVELAVYLYVLGEVDQSKDLLLSFIVYEYEEEKGHLWWVHQEGMMLLAHIARLQSDMDRVTELTTIVYQDDFLNSYSGTPENQYLYRLHEHQRNMEYAQVETKKYKCNAMFVELIGFIYLYEMLPYYESRLDIVKSKLPDNIKSYLKATIDNCCSELKQALEDNSRKSRSELDQNWEALNEKYKDFGAYKEVGRSVLDKLTEKVMGSFIKTMNKYDKPSGSKKL